MYNQTMNDRQGNLKIRAFCPASNGFIYFDVNERKSYLAFSDTAGTTQISDIMAQAMTSTSRYVQKWASAGTVREAAEIVGGWIENELGKEKV